MKSRIFALTLAVLLLLSGLYGCDNGSHSENDSNAESSYSSSDTASHQSEADTSDTDETSTQEKPNDKPDTPAETDFFTANGQNTLPSASSIPNGYIPTQTSHLYSLPLEFPDTEGFSALVSDDLLYLFFMEGDTNKCRSYSLISGDIISDHTLCPWFSRGVIANGGAWVMDYSTLTLDFIYADGSKKTVYTDLSGQANGDESAMARKSVAVTEDGKYLLISYGTQQPTALVSLTDGTITNPKALSDKEIWSAEANGSNILLYSQEGTGVFCPEADSYTPLNPKDYVGRFFGSLYTTSDENRLTVHSLTEDRALYAKLDHGESLIALKFGYGVTESFDEQRTINFYNLRNSTLACQIKLSENCYGCYVEILSNGTAIIISNNSDKVELFMLDLPSASLNPPVGQITSLICTDAQLAEKTKDIADTVYKNCGVELIYGSNGNDFIVSDYVATAELNSFKVYLAVCETAQVLEKYPPNMLREAYEKTHKGLKLYLCGKLYGVGQGTLGMAGGVTSAEDGYIVVVLDINDPLSYNIPHELSHAFDHRINLALTENGTDWMQIWIDATPVRNAYTNTYEDYSHNMDYTPYGEYKEENIWFVDGYSRTFPTEDRARIMENLFNPYNNELAAVLQNQNLIYKARLYSYILRQCFPSCNTSGSLYWETHLTDINSSVLP